MRDNPRERVAAGGGCHLFFPHRDPFLCSRGSVKQNVMSSSRIRYSTIACLVVTWAVIVGLATVARHPFSAGRKWSMTYVDDGIEGEMEKSWWAGNVQGRLILAYTSFAHHYPNDDLGRPRREQAS